MKGRGGEGRAGQGKVGEGEGKVGEGEGRVGGGERRRGEGGEEGEVKGRGLVPPHMTCLHDAPDCSQLFYSLCQLS